MKTPIYSLLASLRSVKFSARSQFVLPVIAASCAFAVSYLPASAQTNYTWNGTSGGTGAWTTSGSWTPTGIPGGNIGDTATITQSSVTTSALELVTLSSPESISSLALNESAATGTLELRVGGSSTETLTVANALTVGTGTGTTLLYLDAIDNAKAVYTGNITVANKGVIEMGAASNSSTVSINGSVEVGSGGVINVDKTTTSSFNGAGINGGLTLDSTGTLNFETANSAGTTVTGTVSDDRFTVSGAFLAKTGSSINITSGSGTTTAEITFTGTSTSATFQTGVTGNFYTNAAQTYEAMTFNGSSGTFTLASDATLLPNFNITPGTTSGTATVTIGSVSAAALNIENVSIQGAMFGGTLTAPTGTTVLVLSSNVNTTFLQPSTRGGVGNSIVIDLENHTLASAHSEVLGNIVNPTNWTIEGTTGTFSAVSFVLNGATGATGDTISGGITLIATSTGSTNALGTANGSIDPTSTFAYMGSASGNANLQVTGGTSIGRLAVGATSGAITSTLTLASAATAAGDVTVNTKGTLLLGGFNLTESSASTSNAGGLNGISGAILANSGVASGTNTLTLDTTHGNGSFAGLLEDHVSGGTGTLAIVKGGAGMQTFSGTNTYSGGTTVSGGTLQMGSASALGATTGGLTVGTSGTSATLDLNGHSLTAGSLAGTGTGGVITSSATGNLTVTVANTAGGATTYAGVIQNGSATSVGVTLGATNTATLTLSGSNTYTGATAINGGQLNVTGSTASASAFTVASAAALGGTGTVGGTVQINTGGGINLRDGAIGTLTTGNLTVNTGSGSALTFDITTGSSSNLDKIAAGTLTIGGSSGITINVDNMTGALTTGTTLSTGTYTLISYTGTQLSLANFNAFSLSNTSVDGETLSLNNGANALQLVITTSVSTGTYTLTTTAGASVLHAGASTTLATTLTNTGNGTADSLDVHGLGASSTGGTINNGTVDSSSPVAQTGTLTNNGQTFTASTAGSQTVTGTVTSVTGDNGTGAATQAGNTGANVFVYTGAGVWSTAGGGSWGTTPTATPANWQANGGIPGITAGFTTTDSASFGDTGFSGTATVTLDGATPFLNAISFNNSTGSYEIAQGTGGMIHLDSTGTATITDTLGNHTISAPVELDSAAAASVASSSTLTISGNISESGSRSFAISGPGTTVLSGSNTYSGGTSLTSGTLLLSNTSGSATGLGALTVAAGATLGGYGSSSGSGFSIGATGSRTTVLVGMNSASDTNTAQTLTLIGSGSSSITNTTLQFNISAATPGQGTELSVGTSAITFSNSTLALNVQGVGVIPAYSPYVLIAGTGTNQYSGLTTQEESIDGQMFDVITSGLNLSFAPSLANTWYADHSFLYLNTAGGVDDIEVDVVPEPGTWAMMLGGLAALVFWQRQRSRVRS